MIALSAPTFDINGHMVSTNAAALPLNIGRRARRVATLDGGAVLVDGGYSAADQTFELQIPDPDGAHHRAIHRLMQYHSTAVLSCSQGCYLVLLSGLRPDEGETLVTAEVLDTL